MLKGWLLPPKCTRGKSTAAHLWNGSQRGKCPSPFPPLQCDMTAGRSTVWQASSLLLWCLAGCLKGTPLAAQSGWAMRAVVGDEEWPQYSHQGPGTGQRGKQNWIWLWKVPDVSLIPLEEWRRYERKVWQLILSALKHHKLAVWALLQEKVRGAETCRVGTEGHPPAPEWHFWSRNKE